MNLVRRDGGVHKRRYTWLVMKLLPTKDYHLFSESWNNQKYVKHLHYERIVNLLTG